MGEPLGVVCQTLKGLENIHTHTQHFGSMSLLSRIYDNYKYSWSVLKTFFILDITESSLRLI